MSFFVIEAVLIVISIILAKRMVAKRIEFAKRLVIGKDSEEDIQKMEQLAEKILSSPKEIAELEGNDLTINVEAKEGKIVKVTVESQRTKVISSKENGTKTFNNAWTEKGAVAITAFTLWGIALWLHILIALWVECQMALHALSQMAP